MNALNWQILSDPPEATRRHCRRLSVDDEECDREKEGEKREREREREREAA
jgi:hypothetical protein